MRISASGLASTIEVAIVQILRLAPSISGPIEPVVSSTKPTSTMGLACAWLAMASGESIAAMANAFASLAIMFGILERMDRWAEMLVWLRDRGWSELRWALGRLQADFVCVVAVTVAFSQ